MFKFLYMVAITGLLLWGVVFFNQTSEPAQAIDDFMRNPQFSWWALSIMCLPLVFIFYGVIMSISRRRHEKKAREGELLSRAKRRARMSMLSG
jgi:hypothetical protein